MKYEVGDRVRIKPKFHFCSVDEFNNINMKDEYFNQYSRLTYCETVMTISIVNKDYYVLKEDKLAYKWTDDMIECKVEAENTDCEKCGLTHNSTRCLFMDNCPHNKQKTIIEIPEDWVLKDENGNVINARKVVLEKKKNEYPKTYEECCKIFGLNHYLGLSWNSYDEYSGVITGLPKRIDDIAKKLESLSKLLICRDAYWKIAGEEMGLGKPWEHDCNSGNFIPAIIYRSGSIQKVEVQYRNAILSFPTEEMRDAFKENFDPDIEICKEFL